MENLECQLTIGDRWWISIWTDASPSTSTRLRQSIGQSLTLLSRFEMNPIHPQKILAMPSPSPSHPMGWEMNSSPIILNGWSPIRRSSTRSESSVSNSSCSPWEQSVSRSFVSDFSSKHWWFVPQRWRKKGFSTSWSSRISKSRKD